MKFHLFFLFFLVLGSVNAFSLDFSFSEYSLGTTTQIGILINGTLEENLKSENIDLVCSGLNIDIVPNLLNIGNGEYYLYFDNIGVAQDNCTLIFNDVIYYESGFLKQMDFVTNISFVENNQSKIMINPAGIVFNDFESQNFMQLQISNTNDFEISVSISSDLDFIEFDIENFVLSPEGFSNSEIYFSEFVYAGEEKGIISLEVNNNTFTIPVWINIDYSSNPGSIPGDDDEEPAIHSVGNNIEILQGLEGFDLIIASSEDKSGYVLLQNSGADIDLVEFKLSGDIIDIVDLQNENLKDFNSGDKFREYIYVNQKKTAEFGNYTGSLEIHYESEVIKLPILIKIEEVEINQTFINETVLPGTEKEENGINVWLLVLLFVILAGAILFLSYKKKTKKSVDFLKNV